MLFPAPGLRRRPRRLRRGGEGAGHVPFSHAMPIERATHPSRRDYDSERNDGELYRLLVESVRDYAIFALDATGHVLTWNPGAERFKGYQEHEIVGPAAGLHRGA